MLLGIVQSQALNGSAVINYTWVLIDVSSSDLTGYADGSIEGSSGSGESDAYFTLALNHDANDYQGQMWCVYLSSEQMYYMFESQPE
jgi:hypothetical protein